MQARRNVKSRMEAGRQTPHNRLTWEGQMDDYPKYGALRGRLVILGFGSIGQAVVPLLFRHFDLEPSQVTVVSRGPDQSGIAEEYGIGYEATPLREGNVESILDPLLQEGGFLLNLSVDVSSLDLIRYCWRRQILYLDTCTEPWKGFYDDEQLSQSQRSNYALREAVLAFRLDKRHGATAVVTQGANPGLASVLVKQALMNMARDQHIDVKRPTCYEDWATGDQGDPHRRARYANVQPPQGARRIRQHLVGGRFCQRRPAARGAGLGQP
jgi:homospermidine synthase